MTPEQEELENERKNMPTYPPAPAPFCGLTLLTINGGPALVDQGGYIVTADKKLIAFWAITAWMSLAKKGTELPLRDCKDFDAIVKFSDEAEENAEKWMELLDERRL